jgi:uncharacterized protein YchJ
MSAAGPCPCGLAAVYADCCGPYYAGVLQLQVPTAEALMRRAQRLHETSRFVHEEGQRLYLDGDLQEGRRFRRIPGAPTTTSDDG